jgi:hypothetical protein
MLNKPLFIINEIKVYGNNHNVPLVYWYELSNEEQKDFDYINNPEDNFTGFRYKGNVRSLDEFMREDKNSPFYGKFDGHSNDTFFSGVGIKFTDDSDSIKVYTYYS